ncbi:hypothetical protein [Pseudanabaena sp. 'Roaring Creek']|uniref:hypothetical protein n=1 Tax=Pseudanabaena sp. 'Roaring Creek' TaxID=1681830 RepID=UPI0006D85235|nr:hypothetical protein [Pseudanabaena sp. 'Roaring Creek']
MESVYGIFVSGQFAPEIVVGRSARDAFKIAFKKGLVTQADRFTCDIRQLLIKEMEFWSNAEIPDRDLLLAALRRTRSPVGDLLIDYLDGHTQEGEDFLEFIDDKKVGLYAQKACWNAIVLAMDNYKASVQRDRILQAANDWLENISEMMVDKLCQIQSEVEEEFEQEWGQYAA